MTVSRTNTYEASALELLLPNPLHLGYRVFLGSPPRPHGLSVLDWAEIPGDSLGRLRDRTPVSLGLSPRVKTEPLKGQAATSNEQGAPALWRAQGAILEGACEGENPPGLHRSRRPEGQWSQREPQPQHHGFLQGWAGPHYTRHIEPPSPNWLEQWFAAGYGATSGDPAGEGNHGKGLPGVASVTSHPNQP